MINLFELLSGRNIHAKYNTTNNAINDDNYDDNYDDFTIYFAPF